MSIKKDNQEEAHNCANTKNKKNTGLYAIIIMLIILIIASSALGLFAWAKYKTTVNGTATGQLANWHFELKEGTTETGNTLLALTRTDDSEHVAAGVIAPGTYGELPIVIDTTNTNVDLTYDLTITITNFPQNMVLTDLEGNTITPTVTGEGTTASPRIAKINVFKYVPYATANADRLHDEAIKWNWPYETGTSDEEINANDIIDTNDAGKEFSVAISVTGKEVQTLADVVRVGDTITYSPSGTYSWAATYATSDTEGTTTLSSATGESYNITTWKVLSIDEKTGDIEMVPATPTTGTVTLQGAQGYNNAVYLLNEACSELYSDSSKGITARSIKEEDFVEAGGTTWTDYRATYKNSYNVTYGNQYTPAYTSNKYYPSIYAQEINSVINGTKSTTGYSQSEQTSLIGRTDDSATNGYLNASTSIQPYQTYYNTNNYSTTAGLLGDTYSGILLPNGSSTSYWVASRLDNVNSSHCGFNLRRVDSGYLNGYGTFGSNEHTGSDSRELFPVVSLNSKLLETTDTEGVYNVK